MRGWWVVSSVEGVARTRRGGGAGVGGERRGRRAGVSSSRGLVGEVQRARMLSSAARVVADEGFEGMSVVRVARGAGVSRRTFYEIFESREGCFLALFEDALGRVRERVLTAYENVDDRRGWPERVRAALTALLELFDEEPQLASLLVVDALRRDSRVLASRAKVLAELGLALHEGGITARKGRGRGRFELPPVTGESVVGGVLAVLHTRLSSERPGSLLALRNTLAGMTVMPYLGAEAARREFSQPAPTPVRRRRDRHRALTEAHSATVGARSDGKGGGDPLRGLPMRLTYRTLRVLDAIAQRPGASNRIVGELAGVTDQGQISKLLARLERLELVRNTGRGHLHGETNAWRLTPRGMDVALAVRTPAQGEGASSS